MKNVKIIVIIIVFVLLTCILSTNDNKMYEKKKHFNSSSEVLTQLANNDFIITEQGKHIYENSDSFNECFSKRKRLTHCGIDGVKMNIQKVYELDHEGKEKILKNYKELSKSYKNVKRKINKIEPIKIKARIYNMNYYQNSSDIREEDKYDDAILIFVMVDEGEGMVIDYVEWVNIQDKETGEIYD